jgi:hypothetical protein
MTTRFLQVANAGVNEVGDYVTPKVKNGKPEKPSVATVGVNFLGSIYSKNCTFSYIYALFIYSSYAPGHLLFGT